jgi:hypothetical protein
MTVMQVNLYLQLIENRYTREMEEMEKAKRRMG